MKDILNFGLLAGILIAAIPINSASDTACSEEFNGKIISHPSDCHKFLICNNQVGIEYQNPSGLHFSPRKQIFVKLSESECKTKVSQLSSVLDSDVVTSLPGKECEPDTTFPYPGNCAKYFKCIGGYIKIQDCDEGLLFNFKIQKCDLPENTECFVFPTAPPEPSTTAEITTTTEVTTESSSTEEVTTTTEATTEPTSTEEVTTTTESSSTEETTLGTTETTQSTTDVTTTEPSTEPTTTQAPETTTEEQCEQECECGEPTPHLGDCSKFYYCVNNCLREKSCPEGLLFNPDLHVCDFPSNVNCAFESTTEASTTTPCNTTPDSPSTTPRPTVITPSPETSTGTESVSSTEDSTSASETTTSAAETTTSATETTTSAAETTTSAAETTTSAAETTTSAAETTTSAAETTTSSSGGEDECIHGEYLPYPGDCNKFYQCVWGKKVTQICPPGLHFNTKLNVCDYPNAAGCKQN